MEQRDGPRVVPAPAGRQGPPQGGQRPVPHAGQPPGGLPPDAGQSLAQVQPLACRGGRGPGAQRGKIRLPWGPGQGGALLQKALRVPAGALRPPEAACGSAEKAQGKNGPLVGVHAAGGGKHGPLGGPPRLPERLKGGAGRLRGGLHAGLHTPGPVGGESGRAAQEGEKVHVPVAAGVGAVHQPGLGGDADLLQQRLRRQSRRAVPVGGGEVGCENPPGGLLELRNGVQAAGGAPPPGLAADHAAPGPAAHGLPRQPASPGRQHVHIPEPPQGGALLNGHAQLLHLLRRARRRVQPFAPGGSQPLLLGQNRQAPGAQSGLQLRPAGAEGPAQQGGVLHRARHIHGKRDQRPAVPAQHRFLPPDPVLPGPEHLLQRHFHGGPPCQ